MIKKNILITGGCRSGKSRHALSFAKQFSGRKVYLATAEVLDSEMEKRVTRHREERGKDWVTIEEPIDLSAVLEREGNTAEIIVVDCLTLWINNLLMKEQSSDAIHKCIEDLVRKCGKVKSTLVFITNEVGGGIVPENRLARDFRDIAGEINQTVAEAFDEVIHMVSGIPVTIKEAKNQPSSQSATETRTNEFSPEKRAGFYEAIYKRRDVRHFLPRPIDPATLGRVLDAAHHAGSVGYMQPWNFIVIHEPEIKRNVARIFRKANEKAALKFQGERQDLYRSLKLEGITDAPVNICITCDRTRFGPNVLGRDSIPETDIFSTCCAVQNLWLAARVEGLAVGWVSILSQEELRRTLNIPENILPVAYLCIGHTEAFYEKPMLETAGWGKRLNLKNLIYYNQWQGEPHSYSVKLQNE